ncbi:hypothetical protein INT80_06490 [Gallibacterium anatis]|uniref:Uncharacterized protein n=1 Tax=Gallibacterium anatis TaxID=750 RepID=A0A930URD1_9PAST|nr:hypothetical protein [Gallibacterium anatis]
MWGGNLLYNPIFANNADGWSLYQNTNVVNANSGININNNSEGSWQGKIISPVKINTVGNPQ